jgi:hypothetical protein
MVDMDVIFVVEAEARKAADAMIRDWQRAVAPGHKVTRPCGDLIIYGEILDVIETERPYYDLNNPDEAAQFASVQSMHGDCWSKSYCFGRFYSEACPEGEYGDIHRASIRAVISDETFEKARAAGWPSLSGLVR